MNFYIIYGEKSFGQERQLPPSSSSPFSPYFSPPPFHLLFSSLYVLGIRVHTFFSCEAKVRVRTGMHILKNEKHVGSLSTQQGSSSFQFIAELLDVGVNNKWWRKSRKKNKRSTCLL